jgi:hypothetical protein
MTLHEELPEDVLMGTDIMDRCERVRVMPRRYSTSSHEFPDIPGESPEDDLNAWIDMKNGYLEEGGE